MSDWTIPQDWNSYTAQEHAVWDTLFARQSRMLEGRTTQAFLRGMNVLRLSRPGIPNFEELSERLAGLTGWRVVAVPGLVPDEVFFEHLANRRFVVGRFIRTPEELDYLEEPDVFNRHVHDFVNVVDAGRWTPRNPASMSRSAILPTDWQS